jgi:hypothetical protein
MRGQGQLTCLATGRENKKRNRNSYMYMFNVSCSYSAKCVYNDLGFMS